MNSDFILSIFIQIAYTKALIW